MHHLQRGRGTSQNPDTTTNIASAVADGIEIVEPSPWDLPVDFAVAGAEHQDRRGGGLRAGYSLE